MYLKKGDTIGIVSPSRAIKQEELKSAIEFLENEGFKVELSGAIFEKDHQFAGTDEQRAQEIQSFINNKDIKGIWAARGGYGAVRIIDLIDFEPLKSQFKWFIGYSDFTVFHAHLNRVLQIPSIHATMPISIDEQADDSSQESLLSALRGDDLKYKIKTHPLHKEGDANGELIGGNLSILYSLCGSASMPNMDGKILFIEDLDEYLYHIDRMMMNLKRSGVFNQLEALIVGGMSDMNDNIIPFGSTAEEIIYNQCKDFDFPIYFGFDAGHLQPNLALRFGQNAELKDNTLILPA
ncbi:MAG: LD-carboxypeptidase [Bacteroidia bacterium]